MRKSKLLTWIAALAGFVIFFCPVVFLIACEFANIWWWIGLTLAAGFILVQLDKAGY